MKTIRTRYSNGRITASDGDGASLRFPYDYALNSDENHAAAAKAFIAREGWHCTTLAMGWYKNDAYHVAGDIGAEE